jgi:pimeloyl-ACP methyl ester carboxylesterase
MSNTPDKTLQGSINLSGSKLFYEMIGDGLPMVLIHDGLVHREVWDEQFDYFSQLSKVVRYDRRGYGRSEPPKEDYSNVDDLLALLDHLQIERAILMGVSAGGMIAIDFCLAFPSMVDALVLVGSGISGFEISEQMMNQIQAAVKPLVENDDVEQTIENWANDPYLVTAENSIAHQKFRSLLISNPHNLYDPHRHSFEEISERAVRRLSEIKAPALIVVGEYDRPDNHAMAGALQVGIIDSKRVVFHDAGHLVNLEQPEEFNLLVSEFLNNNIRK